VVRAIFLFAGLPNPQESTMLFSGIKKYLGCFVRTKRTLDVLICPVRGKSIRLDKVQDEVFSREVLGKGIAIIPEEGRLYAPVSGHVETMFDTGHAISLVSKNGAEILLHVGIETVALKGRHFKPRVKSGKRIRKGELLLEFDLNAIIADGYDPVIPVVITNSEQYSIDHSLYGDIREKQRILVLQKSTQAVANEQQIS
jgi:PTS system beta-glucosides-specific IIC component